MVVDSSALIAVLADEPDAATLFAALTAASRPVISAATYVEASIVADNMRRPGGAADLDRLIAALAIEIVPFDTAQAGIARQAARDYGRGNHPAKLNFGDCFSYALAIARHEPLLFKGDDFALTDVLVADAAAE